MNIQAFSNRIIFIFISGFISFQSSAINLDSLLQVFNKGSKENKIEAALELSDYYQWKNLDSSLLYSNFAFDWSEEVNDQKMKGKALISMALALSNFDSILVAQTKLKQAEEVLIQLSEEKKSLGLIYNLRGLNYSGLGDLPKSLEAHLKSLKIRESIKDSIGIAGSLNNIGNVYSKKKEYEKAKDYYWRAKKLNTRLNNQRWLLINIGNIGNTSYYLQQYDSAQYWHKKAFELAEELEDVAGMARSLLTLGNVCLDLKDWDCAEENYIKSMSYTKEGPARPMFIYGPYSMGALFIGKREYKKAIQFLNEALDECKRSNNRDFLPELWLRLNEAYDSLGMTSKAYEAFKNHILYRDSIYNNEKGEELVRLQMTYDFEKSQMTDSIRQAQEKQSLILKNQKESEIAKKEIEKRNLIIYLGGGTLLIILLGAGYIFRQYKQKKTLSELVSLQKNEVEKQKRLIEDKAAELSSRNKEITDSINYAKHIQNAVIPDPESIHDFFDEAFIIYEPKDIVSGDFYWFGRISDKIICVLADCTGHGVPGALMSIMGSGYLDSILKDKNVTDPAKALEVLDQKITGALWSSNKTLRSNDGMDIAICVYDEKNGLLQYAGAKRPLYIFRKDGYVDEIKPDKFSIGGSEAEIKQFHSHNIEVNQGDKVYLFSDGIVDQFGGDKGKKLKVKQLKELLSQLYSIPMPQQKSKLLNHFNDWKGDLEQVDDVCVIGVRL